MVTNDNDMIYNMDNESIFNAPPTVLDANGRQLWLDVSGSFHREDGPAVIHADGTQEWWVNGKRHRENGPAYIGVDGSQAWYVNGKQHRLDGPAIIYADGSVVWLINGKFHRLDGPAIIWPNGIQEWWVNGINITTEVEQWMKNNNITYPFSNESLFLFKLMFC